MRLGDRKEKGPCLTESDAKRRFAYPDPCRAEDLAANEDLSSVERDVELCMRA